MGGREADNISGGIKDRVGEANEVVVDERTTASTSLRLAKVVVMASGWM
jgi:hypothetical protein